MVTWSPTSRPWGFAQVTVAAWSLIPPNVIPVIEINFLTLYNQVVSSELTSVPPNLEIASLSPGK